MWKLSSAIFDTLVQNGLKPSISTIRRADNETGIDIVLDRNVSIGVLNQDVVFGAALRGIDVHVADKLDLHPFIRRCQEGPQAIDIGGIGRGITWRSQFLDAIRHIEGQMRTTYRLSIFNTGHKSALVGGGVTEKLDPKEIARRRDG